MCFVLLLQANLQGFSLSLLRRQLLQGCSCSLFTLAAIGSILVGHLPKVTSGLISKLSTVLAGLPHPGATATDIQPDSSGQQGDTPIQRHYCSTSSARL